MQRRWFKMFQILLAVAAATACGGALKSSSRLELPAIGFSMEPPTGWTVSRRSRDLCFKGDGNGMVVVEPYHGRFEDFVDQAAADFGCRVLSRSPIRVGGHAAIEVVSRQDRQAVKTLELFIDLGGRAATVSFVVPRAAFAAEEPAFRKALESIKID